MNFVLQLRGCAAVSCPGGGCRRQIELQDVRAEQFLPVSLKNIFFFFYIKIHNFAIISYRCSRCRKVEPGKTPYEVQANSVKQNESILYADLFNKDTGKLYALQLTALKGNTFRLWINESDALHRRYEVQEALKGAPQTAKLDFVEKTADHVTVANGKGKAIVYFNPFRVDLYSDEQLVISANARGLMRYEHLRLKRERSV